MQIFRMFSKEKYKGERNYLRHQKKYEILRTALYFAISGSLFLSGWYLTESRLNLMTVVAVLGCLPASKSAVAMIMFLRFQSCEEKAADEISRYTGELAGCFDMVFTSYDKNFSIAHMAVRGNTVCGYTENPSFQEQPFYKHLSGLLKADGFQQVSIKIFTDLQKYTERLEQMRLLEADERLTDGILNSLKSVSL